MHAAGGKGSHSQGVGTTRFVTMCRRKKVIATIQHEKVKTYRRGTEKHEG